MPLNQSEAEKIAKLVTDAVFDRWQRDNGMTKDTMREIITDELTRRRPDDKKTAMDEQWVAYGMYLAVDSFD